MAADPELVEEQAHLDQTYAAYDALIDVLSVSRRDRHGDVFTEEVLEQMRLERLRAYTSASGPLYFGRIDRDDGSRLYVGRHAVADAHAELLAINWRAPAAEPFYAATTAEPRGVTRRRRLDIEDRSVLGFVDEQLAAGEHDHLTDAIVEDITRLRVGEMRQIISTITPEQYALITQQIEGTLVVQGGPGTGKTAVGLHRAAWLLYADRQLAREGVLVVGPEPRLHHLHLAGAAGARRGERGAAGDRRAGVRSPVGVGRERGARDAARVRADGGAAATAAVGAGRRAGGAETMEVGRVPVVATPAEVSELIEEARDRRTYELGRERFRVRLADRLATQVVEGSRAGRARITRPCSRPCGRRASTSGWSPSAGRGRRPKRSSRRCSRTGGG